MANCDACAGGAAASDVEAIKRGVEEKLADVQRTIIFLASKGGVGKSTISAYLSVSLAKDGNRVGLLDMDLNGPSVPHILGMDGQNIMNISGLGMAPVYADIDGEGDLGVMSMAFQLPNKHTPLIWREARKNRKVKEFLADVHWGELDFLFIDMPPGISDEHISMFQYLPRTTVEGAIILTTPHEVSLVEATKSINFCNAVKIKVLGVVENMSELRLQLQSAEYISVDAHGEEHDVTSELFAALELHAPHLLSSSIKTPVFNGGAGGAEKMCKQMNVPFFGKVPYNPNLGQAADEGRLEECFEEYLKCSVSAGALQAIIDTVLKVTEKGDSVSA